MVAVRAASDYLDLTGSGAPTKTTFYYDPIIDVHHRLPVRAALFSCFYSSAQVPDDARRLFDAASEVERGSPPTRSNGCETCGDRRLPSR